MNLRPIKDQIVVLPDPAPEKIGSIFVPDAVAKDNPNFYPASSTVVAVGPGRIDEGRRIPPDVKIGDRVMHGRFAGNQITCDDDGVLYLVMREAEIWTAAPEMATALQGYQEASDEGIKSYETDPFAGM